MPLPSPAPRRHLHTRAVTYTGFLRDDGLWDIEAELSDTKTEDIVATERPVPAGTPIHGMRIRITLDDAMTIREIHTAMEFTPFDECQQGTDPMQRMVGVKLGPGWRQAIEKALGGVRGCTHLREMLFNMATAAYQTVFPYKAAQRTVPSHQVKEPAYHLGRCIAWDYNGPVVARHYPQFAGYEPISIVKKAL